MYSCTDTWNDHYDAEPVLTGSGSTLETIKNSAPDFYNVIKATGYDKEISNGNLYTFWAPKTIGEADAADIQKLLENGADSVVIRKYIKNHISRYTYTLGNSPVDNITLLNNKRASMGTAAQPTFMGLNILASEGKACKDGIVHIIDGVNEYVPNLYEGMEDRQKYDKSDDMSICKYLEQFNGDTLIVDKSIAGGYNDKGEREYIDAFYRRNNTELNRIGGQIFEEDSSFTFILPSINAYNERYEFARKHLVFNPNENTDNPNYTDSLSRYYAGKFAMQDLIFSNNKAVNQSPNDSLISVNYSRRNWENHVYYNPTSEGGILAGLQGIPCSNGTLYQVDEYPMSVVDQFFSRIKLSPTKSNMDFSVQEGGTKAEAWATDRADENPTSSTIPYNKNKITRVVDESGVATYDTIQSSEEITLNFLACRPANRTAAPAYSFKIPNTLAADFDEYEIKLVLIPEWLSHPGTEFDDADLTCTCRFKADIYYKGDNGKYISTSVPLECDPEHMSEDKKYIISKNLDENNALLYADTITLRVPKSDNPAAQKNPFPYAYYNRVDPGVILKLTPNATSTQINKKEYTRSMLVSKIIFEPKPKAVAKVEE